MLSPIILLFIFLFLFFFMGAFFSFEDLSAPSAFFKAFFSSLAIFAIIILFLIIS
jgi:hypothetical protein